MVDLHVAMSSLANSQAAMNDPSAHSSKAPARAAVGASLGARGQRYRWRQQHRHLRHGPLRVGELIDKQEQLTEKALQVVRRVMDKLDGLDFADHWTGRGSLQAHRCAGRGGRWTSSFARPWQQNLCLSYFGWCLSATLWHSGVL